MGLLKFLLWVLCYGEHFTLIPLRHKSCRVLIPYFMELPASLLKRRGYGRGKFATLAYVVVRVFESPEVSVLVK